MRRLDFRCSLVSGPRPFGGGARACERISVRGRLQQTDVYDLFRFIIFQTPTIHGIEFTWEKVKKKLDLDGCEPLNATGKVTTFHTDLEQSLTEQLRLVWASVFYNSTLTDRKVEKELQRIRSLVFSSFFCYCYC